MHYEFRSKMGIASTLQGKLIVGARAFHDNPYDGQTLSEQLEQATMLMQDSSARPPTAFLDLDYRGVDAQKLDEHIAHRDKTKRSGEQERKRKRLRRRQSIKPIIGHIKSDHRMDRCHLKWEKGDRLHAVLCASGYNIRWLLRTIPKKWVAFFRPLCLRLCEAAGIRPNWPQTLRT